MSRLGHFAVTGSRDLSPSQLEKKPSHPHFSSQFMQTISHQQFGAVVVQMLCRNRRIVRWLAQGLHKSM